MRTGFRTVRLEFAEVELPAGESFKYAGAGTAFGKTDLKKLKGEFKFYVNDVPIFMKGTNWVPLDAYHNRDKEHVKAAVDMLADLNCNMVRCWGGNVYEDHDFFDLCDKYGILVWQDFSLACCITPQNADFAKKMEQGGCKRCPQAPLAPVDCALGRQQRDRPSLLLAQSLPQAD